MFNKNKYINIINNIYIWEKRKKARKAKALSVGFCLYTNV